MKVELSIQKDMDAFFKQICAERGIALIPVTEYENEVRYSLVTSWDKELWYLGYLMGLEKGIKICNDVRHNQL